MIKLPFIILSITIFLQACSNIPFPLYQRTYENLANGLLLKDPIVIDQEYISSKSFDSIRVRFGRSSSIIMVLLNESNGIKEWISADKGRIFTFNGKIIKTSGLKNDIELLNFNNTLIEGPDSYLVNYYDPILLNQLIKSNNRYLKTSSLKNIISSKQDVQVNIFEEITYNERINWKSKNKYYYDLEGNIVRTEQYIHPFIQKISIDFIDAY